MWHVDEGSIHAYLDGALDHLPAVEAERIREHLASCGACAGRLEEERALRAEAQAILAGVDPGVGDVPSLEELRLRAPSPRRSAGVAARRLGLAASLVLAVGTGWLLRGSQAPRFQDAVAPTRSGPFAEEAVAVPTVEADGEAAPGRALEALPEAVIEAPRRDEGAPAAARERAASPIPGGAPPAPEGAPAVHLPAPAPTVELADLVRPVVTTEEAKRVAEDPLVADAASTGRGGALKVLQDSLEARLGEARVSLPGEKAALPPVSVLPRAADVPPGLPAAQGARAQQPPLDPVLTEALARRRTAEAEAVRQASVSLNAGAKGVPGLPVLAVFQGQADLPAGSTRILQSLNGDTLEVIHVSGATAEPDLPRPTGDDRTQVAVRRGDGWWVARGRESRETLLRLLERVGG